MNVRTRRQVLALLAVGTMINYLDRAVLGVAAPAMSTELHLSPEMMGVLLSAFSWSYAASQIPGGWFLDRFGNRMTYFLAVSSWSLFTLFQGFARGLTSLLTFRLGLGVSEAPCFPVNGRVVTEWFPEDERARATAVYTVGEYVGLGCFGPLMFWVLSRFGWRTLFLAVGAMGLAFSLVWLGFYREKGERAANTPTRLSWRGAGDLLRSRKVWGASIGQFGGNSTLTFFLTWFPTWLATERHLNRVSSGFYAAMPFVGGACGVIFGGWLSDKLLKLGSSLTFARKLPIVAGLLGASAIVMVNILSNDVALISLLSAVFFAQGMTGLGWAVITDIAPKGMIGLTGGIFNLAANLAGIATPLVIGFIVGTTHSFVWAFAYVSGMALLGVFSYIFLLGNVERIPPNPRPRAGDECLSAPPGT